MAALRTASLRLLSQRSLYGLTARPYSLPVLAIKQLRSMSSTSSLASSPSPSNLHIKYSNGCDPSAAQPELDALLNKESGAWELTQDAQGIKRDYKFKSFKQAWAFMSAIAEQCSVEKHHPEWSNVYNQVSITWTTHRPRGLSLKDLRMAKFCDEQAALHQEIVVPPPFGAQSQS